MIVSSISDPTVSHNSLLFLDLDDRCMDTESSESSDPSDSSEPSDSSTTSDSDSD